MNLAEESANEDFPIGLRDDGIDPATSTETGDSAKSQVAGAVLTQFCQIGQAIGADRRIGEQIPPDKNLAIGIGDCSRDSGRKLFWYLWSPMLPGSDDRFGS